jgi:hypothetical protein
VKGEAAEERDKGEAAEEGEVKGERATRDETGYNRSRMRESNPF